MKGIDIHELKYYLDEKVHLYNQPDFIQNDPISVPHQYSQKQDREISGLLSAVLAWGQRQTIIRKCNEFFSYMDHAPYDFILNHHEDDLKPFTKFVHRTFNATDALYFIEWFRWFYQRYSSLEDAFFTPEIEKEGHVGPGLVRFYDLFFSLPDHPHRTRKHIQNPLRKSACKRINMYLRWMVRKDQCGVDFGLWSKIPMSHLICPLDLHVDRVARQLGMISRKQTDWQTAMELTALLNQMDPDDPVKYDFALFGLGVMEKN